MLRRRQVIGVAAAVVFLAALAGQSAAASMSVTSTPASDIQAISQQIDTLVTANYANQKVRPNKNIGHDIFLRRTYLSIAGRIPTHEEAVAFLNSRNANKRAALIDELLDSGGYVSHHFNFWADILRVKSRLNRVSGQPYIDWLKQALRDNTPYDRLVHELITADGYITDNGAAGYYLRDFAMPLDNTSNTTQIFLGTSIKCAQCHDHKFEDWTQPDYYQMAAYTYGVQTQRRGKNLPANVRGFMRAVRKEDRFTKQAARGLIAPLQFAVHDSGRKLRLPKDYKYKNAAPNSVVEAKAMFGEVAAGPGRTRREAYADWLTAPDNPRFTMVIANRLWKHVFGVGVIDPVDDISPGYNDPSNPDLLDYLVEQMVALDYDMKQYLRALYNTKAYQRAASREEWTPGYMYHFQGPILRRMTAEQIWDSMLVLSVADLDTRQGKPTRRDRRMAAYPVDELKDKSTEELLALARSMGSQRREGDGLRKQIQAARKAKDQDRLKALRRQQRQIRTRMEQGSMSMGGAARQRPKVSQDPRRQGFPPNMVRASELPSPAPPGHFLRRFGQSDRELVENASDDATVTQILNMLNGPLFSRLMKMNSVLVQNVKGQDSTREKIDVIFTSIYSRKPTSTERTIALREVKDQGGDGLENVVWALLNTRQFMFIK